MLVFDTYALIEIIEGNKNFEKYIDETPIVTEFILAELAYYFAKRNMIEKANSYLQKYTQHSQTTTPEILVKAAILKQKHKKKKLSITDCIGYCLAKSMEIKFLTGDTQFQNMQNVEYMQ